MSNMSNVNLYSAITQIAPNALVSLVLHEWHEEISKPFWRSQNSATSHGGELVKSSRRRCQRRRRSDDQTCSGNVVARRADGGWRSEDVDDWRCRRRSRTPKVDCFMLVSRGARCQLASKSVHSFSKNRVHEFGYRRTDGRPENMTDERMDRLWTLWPGGSVMKHTRKTCSSPVVSCRIAAPTVTAMKIIIAAIE